MKRPAAFKRPAGKPKQACSPSPVSHYWPGFEAVETTDNKALAKTMPKKRPAAAKVLQLSFAGTCELIISGTANC